MNPFLKSEITKKKSFQEARAREEEADAAREAVHQVRVVGVRRPGLHDSAGLSRVRRRGRAKAKIQEEMVCCTFMQLCTRTELG